MMTIYKEEIIREGQFKNSPAILIQRFYDLRKTFQAEYSNELRSHKYEATRDFTIALNYAIFEANQFNLNDTKSYSQLSNTFETIRLQYQKLNQ